MGESQGSQSEIDMASMTQIAENMIQAVRLTHDGSSYGRTIDVDGMTDSQTAGSKAYCYQSGAREAPKGYRW